MTGLSSDNKETTGIYRIQILYRRLVGHRPFINNPREQQFLVYSANVMKALLETEVQSVAKGRDQSGSGAIVAAIVVVVIIIFTVVLILLKMYNRKMRTRRELEPKGPKPASPSALDPNSNSSQHPATVTFSPVEIHVETR
ncbi:hypothetical protein CB1_001244047 [Camelus ferus]|nr:hypothetical protein CB1_001244047 [Camelus ferus]